MRMPIILHCRWKHFEPKSLLVSRGRKLIGKRFRTEDLAMERYCQRKTFELVSKLPETPFNDALERAAELIGDGMTVNQLRYEIKTYATRNAISHLGIKKLINESRWSGFALQTQRDLKYLHHAFREAVEPEPEHQTRLRAAIKNSQRKYLRTVYWVDDSTVRFTLTERANKMNAARRRRN
ncbi:hypothetical protein FN846DRAFT_894642 [Sphaerosporella brunnea]|uniref:Uncharacterized protein n=1 Tax=Sphaerosporella brunnea TaxID=1250544 RepID=A0A5J5EGU4_9PEZI|nr:hypothetical protein FN846DRAFT_894642 [Sphaerosporella brunnea]